MSIILWIGEWLPLFSILILFLGTAFQFSKNQFSWAFNYLLCFLIIELFAQFYYKANLFFFSTSAYFHFVFLIHFFYSTFWNSKKARYILITTGIIPLLILLPNTDNFQSYQAYPSLLYDIIIVFHLLAYYLYRIKSLEKNNRTHLRIVNTAFVYFTFDFLLSISSNYLINESLYLVAWFWVLRTTLLQLYYIALIRYK